MEREEVHFQSTLRPPPRKGEKTVRSEMNGGSASNVDSFEEVSHK
ncbi:hypothetical protein BBR01nite_36820 [Brevibacillus brevis]|nr:hypothetical protein BBR01nite_36820 [Brevibacillus brevis]